MAGHKIFNNGKTHANQYAFLSSVSLRDVFLDCLSEGHSKMYTPVALANCLDRISEYVLGKKICVVNLWRLSKYSSFKPAYNNRILNDNQFRKFIIKRGKYNVFLTAGELFLKFLKDKPYAKTLTFSNELNAVKRNATTSILQDTVNLLLQKRMIT